jgi:hypothetical protein
MFTDQLFHLPVHVPLYPTTNLLPGKGLSDRVQRFEIFLYCVHAHLVLVGVWCADFGKEKTKPLDPRSPRLPD